MSKLVIRTCSRARVAVATRCCLEGGILKYLSYNSYFFPQSVCYFPSAAWCCRGWAMLGHQFLCLGLLAASSRVGGGGLSQGVNCWGDDRASAFASRPLRILVPKALCHFSFLGGRGGEGSSLKLPPSSHSDLSLLAYTLPKQP